MAYNLSRKGIARTTWQILGLVMAGSLVSGGDLAGLSRLQEAESRSISPENPTGGKGQGGRSVDGPAAAMAKDLGPGWKISPYVRIAPGKTLALAEIAGPGMIQHIWLTPTGNWRHAVLRMYWDGENSPSVETPLGDFFCQGWGTFATLSSLPVCVNPGNAFNCYWEMPFRKGARLTVENIGDEPMTLFYQIDYALTQVPEDAAYFHAQFRRVNPIPSRTVFTVLDGIKGHGHYVGTYLAWAPKSDGWWGEGEIKFYLDGDTDYPTICGTGTEDYFCGSYNFENKATKQYQEFCTPYAGLHQVIKSDGLYRSQQRFGMYRWHLRDPIHFRQDLRVTIQALGWSPGRYRVLRDDIAAVSFWYQDEPHAPFPKFPTRAALEVE